MDTDTRHTVLDTLLGAMKLVASGDALVGIQFETPASNLPGAAIGQSVSPESDAVLGMASQQLLEFLNSARRTFDIRTHTEGDELQQRVWALALNIPPGETISFMDLTRAYFVEYLQHDISRALEANPLPVLIPTHRIVGRDGNIGAYAHGLDRKRALLEIEGIHWIPRGNRADIRYLTLQPASGGRATVNEG